MVAAKREMGPLSRVPIPFSGIVITLHEPPALGILLTVRFPVSGNLLIVPNLLADRMDIVGKH